MIEEMLSAPVLVTAKTCLADSRVMAQSSWQQMGETLLEDSAKATPEEFQTWAIDTQVEDRIKKELLDVVVLKKASSCWNRNTNIWTTIQLADTTANLNFKACNADLSKKRGAGLERLQTCVACSFAFKAIYNKIRPCGGRAAGRQHVKDLKKKVLSIKGKIPDIIEKRLTEAVHALP